jgi:hypothetical protein
LLDAEAVLDPVDAVLVDGHAHGAAHDGVDGDGGGAMLVAGPTMILPSVWRAQ